MSAVNPYLECGPPTYTVNVPVSGGQLVMPDGVTSRIKPATAGATTVLGVARDDALPEGSGAANAYNTARPEVAVYCAPNDIDVLFAADAPFGTKVKAAADGQATPWAGTDGADQIVGYVTEPAGATAGNRARIKLA